MHMNGTDVSIKQGYPQPLFYSDARWATVSFYHPNKHAVTPPNREQVICCAKDPKPL